MNVIMWVIIMTSAVARNCFANTDKFLVIRCSGRDLCIIIIIRRRMYIYYALINVLSAHMIHM